MIVIKIEIWPLGDESRKKELHRGFIINDGTGTPDDGNYKVILNKRGMPGIKKSSVWRSWRFDGFKRKKLLAWDLLAISLLSCIGKERSKKWSFKNGRPYLE